MSGSLDAALWQQLTQDITTELAAWRLEHPTATLREIEVALDTRLNAMRARMLEDLAAASALRSWAQTPAPQHPLCLECGIALQERSTQSRTLQTHGGQNLTFQRTYGVCPTCGSGLFPPR